MQIEGIDHLVITTKDLPLCLAFYRDLLGLEAREEAGRWSLQFGKQKFNIHTRPAEFLPAAAYPLPGSLDICLQVQGDINAVRQELLQKGAIFEQDICVRHGAQGEMQSLYLRDPDGNLVELGFY